MMETVSLCLLHKDLDGVQKLIFTILLKNCSQKHLVVDRTDMEKLGRQHRGYPVRRALHQGRGRHRHPHFQREGSGHLLQGGPDRHGSEQGVRHREADHPLRQPRHRPPDLPAAYHRVRDVPARGVQAGQHREPGSGDPVHHPALL